MADSNDPTSVRIILGAMATMAGTAFIGLAWTTIDALQARREIAESSYQQHCERDCQQLAAETRAAAAAADAVDLAGQQLWLNFLGILGLGATVISAHGAWKAASSSAKAAHDTLRDARAEAEAQAQRFIAQLEAARLAAEASQRSVESFVAAERAYLYFDDTTQPASVDHGAQIIWRNFGKTPAFVTALRFQCAPRDHFPDPKTAGVENLIPNGAIIAAGETWTRGTTPPFAQLNQFQTESPVYLFGQITYRDIHQVEHHSWFCRLYTGSHFVLGLIHDPELNGSD